MASVDSLPNDCYVLETHEYANVIEEGLARIGITDYAADQLGDIVFVELPEVGDTFDQGESFGSIESVKASSELYMPVSGEITAVNPLLEEEPGVVNDNPFGSGWLIEVSMSDSGEVQKLMGGADYQKFLKDLS
ncbi:MAG: glycine cleavage system protein GcvH [Candidatus Melainabacteria bacterium]